MPFAKWRRFAIMITSVTEMIFAQNWQVIKVLTFILNSQPILKFGQTDQVSCILEVLGKQKIRDFKSALVALLFLFKPE